MTKIHETAIVHPDAQVGEGVEVGPYSVVGAGVTVGPGTRVMSHVVLDGNTTLGAECTVFPFASIGTQTQDLKFSGGQTYVEIGDRTTLREYVTVNSGTNEGEVTRVGSGCHIMAYCHVAHASVVGNGVIMANGSSLAGDVTVEEQAILGGFVGVHQFVRIGRMCMIGGMSRITQDCPPYMLIEGNPAAVYGPNVIGLKRRNVTGEVIRALKEAYRTLYREGLSTSDAVQRIRAQEGNCPEVEALAAFVESSKRGIIK
jgi:UDP-N-acetylglucosamine acyltransferase